MSYLDSAIKRLYGYVDGRMERAAPSRAIVTSVSGNLTYIRRLGASTADAEPYAKVTADTFVVGDEVMVLPVLGTPVIIGKVRR